MKFNLGTLKFTNWKLRFVTLLIIQFIVAVIVFVLYWQNQKVLIDNTNFNAMSLLYFIINSIILKPLFEEFCYRLWIKQNKKVFIKLFSFYTFIGFFIYVLLTKYGYLTSNLELVYSVSDLFFIKNLIIHPLLIYNYNVISQLDVLNFSSISILFGTTCLTIFRFLRLNSKISHFLNRSNSWLLIIISSVIFGLTHFKDDVPIIFNVGYQCLAFLGGVTCSVVRIRLNFWAGYLAHILWNCVATYMAIFVTKDPHQKIGYLIVSIIFGFISMFGLVIAFRQQYLKELCS